MAIPIEKEDPELFRIFRAYEKCVFCCEETDMWNIKRNKPVCPKCAKENKVADIPA